MRDRAEDHIGQDDPSIRCTSPNTTIGPEHPSQRARAKWPRRLFAFRPTTVVVCVVAYEKRRQEHCISTVGSAEINQYTGMSMGCRVSFINQFFLAIWDKIGFVNITQLPFSKSSIRLLIVIGSI